MVILLIDLAASGDDAPYLFCLTGDPVRYQWRHNFSYLQNIQMTATGEDDDSYGTLRNLLTYYAKRDDARFKVLGRGTTIQRLFERYPELLI